MAKTRKKDLAKDIAEYEKKRSQRDLNSVDALVSCCLITDAKQRKKAVAEIVEKNAELRKLLDDNPKLLVSQAEQSLMKLAAGYTVTETTKRISNGRVLTETKTKQIPPNQKAIEYFLNNRAADKWRSNPDGEDGKDNGKIVELMEDLKK